MTNSTFSIYSHCRGRGRGSGRGSGKWEWKRQAFILLRRT